MFITLIIIGVTLVLSAFFSGMEIAYVSSNKVHLEIEKKQGGLMGSLLERITQKPSKFIATMLVGNNIALVIYGFKMGELTKSFLPPAFDNFFWHTFISTVIIVITSEFLPKVVFQIYANTLIKVFAPFAYVFYLLFAPISSFVIWISDVFLRVFFKTSGDANVLSFSKTELVDYISEQVQNAGHEQALDAQVHIFQNALEFSQVRTRDIMAPRTEIIAVSIDESIENLRKLFISTKYSKILVYQNNIDEIIGYVHSFEMFKKPQDIRSVLRPVVSVPETIFISKVLDILTQKHNSLAVVFDEYGGTSGIVTLEDIIEELFGEIEDEHDKIELKELQISEREYVFSARLEVEYLNEKYDLALPEGENYDTLGGLLIEQYGSIPENGAELSSGMFHFIVEEVADNKVLTVRLFKK